VYLSRSLRFGAVAAVVALAAPVVSAGPGGGHGGGGHGGGGHVGGAHVGGHPGGAIHHSGYPAHYGYRGVGYGVYGLGYGYGGLYPYSYGGLGYGGLGYGGYGYSGLGYGGLGGYSGGLGYGGAGYNFPAVGGGIAAPYTNGSTGLPYLYLEPRPMVPPGADQPQRPMVPPGGDPAPQPLPLPPNGGNGGNGNGNGNVNINGKNGAAAQGEPATIVVFTSEGATVSFEGLASEQTGTRHSFTTKPLAPGAEARVTVQVGGSSSSSVTLRVRAGEKATIDMRR
jgi:uncharacterized protein (TIGR03000 family)